MARVIRDSGQEKNSRGVFTESAIWAGAVALGALAGTFELVSRTPDVLIEITESIGSHINEFVKRI